MRAVYDINGFYNDHNKGLMFQKRKFHVNVTVDKIGATLSIADHITGIQYSIPIDGVLRDIKKSHR